MAKADERYCSRKLTPLNKYGLKLIALCCHLVGQAVDEDNEPITGLFAAGVETGTTDWDTYNMGLSGHSFSSAINSGRIAGQRATAYLSH